MPFGAVRRFASEEDIRAAILRGEVPRTVRIQAVQAAGGASAETIAWTAFDDWAKSRPSLRRLYAPVWSLTLRGALLGLVGVGILKALDTLIGLITINPAAAIVWLLIGAGLFTPKYNLHFMAASVFFALKAGVNLLTLWGAWVGVGVFALVFGVTTGMAIGTTIGLLRGHRLERAPDAEPEGNKPLLLGLVVPTALVVAAAIGYVQVFIPAVLRGLK